MFFQFAAVPKMYINSKQMLPMLGKTPHKQGLTKLWKFSQQQQC